MSRRSSASRYARALLDVAIKEGSPEQAGRELDTLVQLLELHQELNRALTHPAVPVSGKRGVVREITKRLSLSPPVSKLVGMLADRDWVLLLPEVRGVYHERLLDHQGVVQAEVTTAVPLADDTTARLQQTLSEVTGRRVAMTTRVDAALIGGVVTRIGSTMYDGSVARQLAVIRQKLVGEA